MGVPSTFKRPLAPVPSGNGAPAPQSRWVGIKSHQPREPLLSTGEYRVMLKSCEVTFNRKTGHETFKTHVEIVDAAAGSTLPVGAEVSVLAIVNGKSVDIGQGRVKAMFVGLTGAGDDPTFDAHDPAGATIDATLNGTGCVGRLVDVTVRPGDKEGFYEYEWSPTEGQDPFFTAE